MCYFAEKLTKFWIVSLYSSKSTFLLMTSEQIEIKDAVQDNNKIKKQ